MQVVVEKLTPERRRELTRSTLIDAAADVFAKRGFHAASLEEIAEAAGFTRGAIYKNFENKEELFYAVIEKRIGSQLERFREVLGEDRDAATDPSRLSAIWEDMLSYDTEWFTLDLEFRLYAMRNENARKTWVAHERQLRDLVARFIEEQQKALGASTKIDADTMAGIVMPASQGFWQWAALDPDQSRYYTEFLKVLIKGVGYEQP
ncbi:MAG: TetR/AcrR family transcriptional regulator [Acidimicrobiia bacterium]|nr:TetR/AcrR family transcriptional regulator [Acidimicrobiia bacterium]